MTGIQSAVTLALALSLGWTATAAAEDPRASRVLGAPASITLTQTVGTTPGVCGASDSISVAAGSTVYFCYVASNTGSTSFTHHTLTSGFGTLLDHVALPLAPGASTPPQIFPQVISGNTTSAGTWTAFAADNYVVDAAAPFAYIPINATGTPLGLADDGEANITSPFPITVYGVSSTQLRIGNNGGILFQATTGDVGFSNAALPGGAAAIYPFWDDLDSDTGEVYWQVQGVAPNRQLIVEWFNRPHFSNVGSATFQVVIREGSSEILFQYLDVDFGNAAFDNGASATIGVNAGASLARQYSFNTASLSNNRAIRLTPPQSAVASDSASVTVLAPDIDVAPLALTASVLDGASTTLPLNIANLGQAPLHWTLVEASPAQRATRPGVHAAAEPVLNVPAAVRSAKDCEAFADYPFRQPDGWEQYCSPVAPAANAAAVRAPTSAGFALNLRAPDQNLKRFTLDNFPGQSVVGPQTLPLYGTDFDASGTILYALSDESIDRLGILDTTTGAFSAIVDCPAPGGGSWTGMAIDPVSDLMYASTAANLYTLSPSSCAPVLVGPFGVTGGLMVAIAVNAAGVMYGHDIGTDAIYTIDTGSGAATLVGPTGLAANFAQGMDFDNEDGTLYLFGYTGGGANVYGRVNLVTGAVTPLAVSSPSGEFEGATQTQALCATSDYPWLQVSPAAGSTAPGATSLSTIGLDAAGLACDATYTAQLCVRSNDPDIGPGNHSRLVQVPVSLTVLCAADLSVTLGDTPDPVVAGTSLVYSALVSNDGPSVAQDLAISLPLPAGTALASADPGVGGNCAPGNPVVCSWAGATAVGASRSVSIGVAVAPAQTASLSATVSATAATLDPNAANNTATATTAVAVQADLSITLTDAPDPVTAGNQLTYTATVTNAGPSDATAVVVSLPTPTGTSFVSGTVTGGGSCAAGISCTISGSMAPGGSRTLTITVLVAPAVLNGTVINATATVTAGSPDPNGANNSASTTTNVIGVADLVVGLTSSTTQVLINVPLTFTATSSNNGPSDAQNVSITLTLTPDFRYSSHVATGATCTTPQIGTTGAIVCTWAGATAPGVTRTLSVVAYSNNEGNTAVNASTTSATTDPVANNNAAALSVVVGFPFNEIPTLSQYGLVLLGLLMGLIGFAAVRRQG